MQVNPLQMAKVFENSKKTVDAVKTRLSHVPTMSVQNSLLQESQQKEQQQ